MRGSPFVRKLASAGLGVNLPWRAVSPEPGLTDWADYSPACLPGSGAGVAAGVGQSPSAVGSALARAMSASPQARARPPSSSGGPSSAAASRAWSRGGRGC
eukprot:12141157-Alexandrium_andersonii.AAC.1